MSRRTKIGIGAGLLALATLGGVLYLRSAHFHRYVQARIVSQIERATGGRVELDSCRVNFSEMPWLPSPPETTVFHTYLPTLQVELQHLVIRGREMDPERPLFAADSISIRLKIVSLLRRKIDWRLVQLTRPRIQLQADSDGRLNIPAPERATAARPLTDKVLDLAVKRLEVTDGELSWNDQRLPMEFAAENLVADFAYDTGTEQYHGRIAFATAPAGSAGISRKDGSRTLAGPPSKVAAELRLGRTGLQIARLNWETPRSSLSLSGQIFASAQPRILLNYEASLDVGEIAAVSQISELRSGRLQLKGQLSYDAAGKALDSSADLRLERLSLGSPAFRLSGIYGTGKVHATREFIEIPDLRLLLLGGEVVGNSRADQLGGQPKLSLAGKARGLSVSRLTHALATRQRPLTKLRWAGVVDGEVKAQFLLGASDRAADLQVESDLSVRPPSVTPPSLLPVSGQGELRYASDAGQVALRNVSLETPASRISGEGVWATGGSHSEHNLQLDLSTSDFQEWAPLIAAWRPAESPRAESPPAEATPAEAPIALERQGQAQLRGTLLGSALAPRLEGHLEATDFRYKRTHWTGFATNLVYSSKLLRLTDAQLRRGSSVVSLNFTARLERGEFTDASHLHLEAVAENAELADLAGLTGTAYPMTGRVTASLQAKGTAGEAQGGGWVRINSGTLAGESFDLLRGELNFAQGELRITNIALTKGPGKITGEAAYRPADGGYQFQLDGAGLALSEISRLRSPRFALGGQVGFRASGAGVLEQPRLEATVELSDLEVNGERIGKLTAAIQTRDGRLEARLKSQLVRGNIAGSLSVQPTGEFPAQGRLELTGVDLDPLFNWLIRGRLTAHSASTGSISISGPLKKPESLRMAAEIRELRIVMERVELRNEGPLRASLRDGRIQIETARLAGTQTNVSVAGWLRVMGPPDERALELHAEGEMNMALLPTLNPELIGSGTVKLNATATGTLQRPLLTGRVQIHNGGVAFKGFPTGLSEMEGSLLFDTRRVRIEKLTAEAGGGKVLLSGFMEYANSPPVLRLQAEAERVRLRYPPGTSSLLNASLSLDGTAQHSVLTGNVVVTRANLSPRSDVASILRFVQEAGSTPVTTRVLHTLHLDVQVTSSPGLRLELANTHDLEVQANLRLRGTAARPAVLGRVELLQGEILFAGTRYIVGRSDISFVDPFRVKPEVNLHLQTRAQQFDIFITLTGPLDRLNATYRSEPPLPGSDVQALLITGRAREGATATQSAQSFSAVGTSAILEQALSAAVGSRIDRLFGAGRVKIATHVGGSQTNPGARLTVEQQVTPDVRFTYITNLTSTQQQVIQVEWTINRRWSLNAVRDRNGLFGVDFKWRKQFR